VKNQGPNAINGLTLSARAASGWSVISGSVNIGTIASGSQRSFSLQVLIGNPAFPSIIFTAKSNDHLTVDFAISVFVSTGVTAQSIAEKSEAVSKLLSIATQWGTYTVQQVGNVIFPTTEAGITDSTGLKEVLQGYNVRVYLGNHPDVASILASVSDGLSRLMSNTGTVRTYANAPFGYSIGNNQYTTSLYQFLSWRFPFSQWTLGIVEDRGVADLLAWAIRNFAGFNVSANDILQLAYLISQVSAGTPGDYGSDIYQLARLVQIVVSAAVPDLGNLNQALSGVSRVLNGLGNVYNFANSLTRAIQNVINWLKNFAQQLYQVFRSLVDWISSHIPLVAGAVNNVIIWLYNTISPVLNAIIDAFNVGSQTQSSAQSAQASLSDMSASVQQSASNQWNQLSGRLSNVAAQAKQGFDGFCGKYQPALPTLRGLTTWLAPVAGGMLASVSGGALNPQTTLVGLLFLENTVDAGCRFSLTGTVDPVSLISIASGAMYIFGGAFPGEESQYYAIGNILNAIGTGIPVANQFLSSMRSSGFEMSAISNIVSNYQSALNQGSSAYQSTTADYIGALNALAPITSMPNLDAVNSVLGNVQPCAYVMAQFSRYVQEGMVAPDLQTQLESCQQSGQSAISAIAHSDYTALSQSSGLASIAAQLNSAIEERYREFSAAKDALDRMDSAASSLQGCGFLWVKPDSAAVQQASQALQQARIAFNAGKYSETVQTVDSSLSQVTIASQACISGAGQVKLEVAGIVCAIIVATAVIAFVYRRRKGRPPATTRRAKNRER